MEEVAKLRRAWNLAPVFSKLLKKLQENIGLGYIYQLTKFCGFLSCGSKDIYSKMNPFSCTNTDHDVTDLKIQNL